MVSENMFDSWLAPDDGSIEAEKRNAKMATTKAAGFMD
jgi:hypothetical protein